ncbi:Asp-tRNA(Asn)/Glu-tRNA(Gln) amidotransferase subunit GatA [Polyangium sp. y55x31]|uniref:Asp-tRNA(Asn)/Glu-tRNA(Gln) amidotransferase subunit GatA n=1 Tax=Polyangium sp. y55x31 TaxID=3042688 RepID=UPI00248275EE|nr:Asp-tRNA(Asn)/Glu-tRNA(Gln) amidotransferase subunit GatA [Polyangium sp. y55x31]MDI1481134.1 Asp-tRNA(Asn)/Glu-tRNA(Gln) amidotransferase subunit GatA [Polyangium sp. y55x31]
MDATVLDRSIPELAGLVTRGEVSAEEVTKACLDRITRRDGALGAFLTVQAEEALQAARAVDQKRARGEALGPLAGVPIGIKDALCTRDAPTTAGSRILLRPSSTGEATPDPRRGFRPPYDATVVARLREADAVLVGKTNMDEFAMGSSNENSAFFPAKNPWDPSRIPGGSSGGSAVAVAAGLALGALGSDTGGSIRQPAALTGTVGIKPTYGRVSRYGLIAFASSLDQVGPFAADVRSAARLLGVIAGRDPHDQTSLGAPVAAYEEACGRDVRGMRIGVPEEYFAKGFGAKGAEGDPMPQASTGIQPAVEKSVREALAGLASLGCELRPVRLPHTRYAVATYYVLATAEASSNLSRYDGVRFGARAEGAESLGALYAKTRGEGFGREVARRIVLGTYVLSSGYYDAYYLRAQRVRTLIRRDFEEAFREVDVIAAPVSPTVAFPLGERVDDPLAMYLADIYTLPASLAGVPALSVPCAPTPAENGVPSLPVGLQLVGPPLEEARLCALAAAWEGISPARGLRPKVSEA